MQRESNHPAHILNINGKFSSSSFIPFCFFGDKGIGSYVAGFDLPEQIFGIMSSVCVVV